MKRLFRVFFKGKDVFFPNKMEAKSFAREMGLKGVVVHRGPDHWKGESDGTVKLTPSSKRKDRR